MRNISMTIVTIASLLVAAPAYPVVTRYTNKAAWFAATPNATTISFTGYPEFTLITDQYADEGVSFTDGNDFIEFHPMLLNDGMGLVSNKIIYGIITLEFAQPRTAIATDFLGAIDIQLYSGDDLIYSSSPFFAASSRFGGLISTIPFDSAVIRDPSDGFVIIDDLFFGPPVPGPGALGLLGAAAFIHRRRRS